jgi:hypothetical protein
LLDETPDLGFFVGFGREQDPHAQLIVIVGGGGGADVVRRQRAWRLVLLVPAQRHGDRRPRSPHVRMRLHQQDRFLSKSLTHDLSMQIAASESGSSPRTGSRVARGEGGAVRRKAW